MSKKEELNLPGGADTSFNENYVRLYLIKDPVWLCFSSDQTNERTQGKLSNVHKPA